MRLMRVAFVPLAFGLILLAAPGGWLAPGAGWATNFGKPQESYFRVESSAGRTRAGRPMVSGYVHNDYGHYAAGVRLVVEQLDRAGRVTATTHGHVGNVPNFDRTYFEVPLAALPDAYRVRITAFEWIQSGDSWQ
jgi:hypothetical protein